MKSEKAVSMIAIHAHDIPHVFPARGARARPRRRSRRRLASGREDWRELPLVTIDPADAKDHDDAVHAEPDTDPENPGGFIVTVAIADVAWYVRPGTALDREALKRGNSVYFPDRVVPMLPERISNDLCSLREGEDRPALAVRMVFAADGRKRSHRFHRIMMRSAAPSSPTGRRRRPSTAAADDKAAPLLDAVLQPLWAAYAGAEARARGARAARTRPARAQGAARAGRHDRPHRRAGAARRAPADRGVHDPGECRRGGDAGGATSRRWSTASTTRPRWPSSKALRDFLKSIDIIAGRGAATSGRRTSTASSTQVQDTEHEALVNEVVLRTQARPSTARTTSAISASTSAATPTSPRRSAAMPTSSSTAR